MALPIVRDEAVGVRLGAADVAGALGVALRPGDAPAPRAHLVKHLDRAFVRPLSV